VFGVVVRRRSRVRRHRIFVVPRSHR
jgi:hypothetical protein